MMHNYTSTDVSSCLESKRIIFVGDSVTRQLFFSMAHLADPSLPSAPPNNLEKHSDHSFPSGSGTEFDFYWDPWLNSTKTSNLLKAGGFGGRNSPGLLVIGSGLWFLRYAESSGGISAWEATIERTLDMISKSMPGLADEIVILPGENFSFLTRTIIILKEGGHLVQEPDESKLSPERATFISNTDIDAMNSDLIYRLSPESPSFNDRDVSSELDYYRSPVPPNPTPVARIMFPSVFNKLLDPSLTEDGLHYNEIVTRHQAQILLNLRCNDILPKKYPLDTTCCSKYPRVNFVQAIVLMALVLYGPLSLVLRRRMPDHAWVQRFFPRDEFSTPFSIFGLAIGLCFVADRTGLWLKEHKYFDPFHFTALCFIACITGLITMKNSGQDLGFLNREQTNEWKGWMQRTCLYSSGYCCGLNWLPVAILFYHYLGGSKISGIYAPIRVLVAR
jgi:hypothetical protein